jgi:uncharacterized cupredoxin-like copper-binding protein
LLAAALWVAACQAASSAPRGSAVRVQQLEVHAEPGLQFRVKGQSPGPLRVAAGREVRWVVVNRDTVQHDLWVVGASDRSPYLSPAFPQARTPLLDPGARYELRFVPTSPGRYRYVCTVPGHDASMHGELVVEAAR